MLNFLKYNSVTYAVVWDGTNTTDILNYLNGEDIFNGACTLSGDTLTIDTPAGTMHRGWYVLTGGGIQDATSFLSSYTDAAANALGFATVPSLAAGANETVPVTIHPALPSGYTPLAFLIGSVTLLGQLSITGTSVVDEETVNVTIHNGALVTVAGGTVAVLCFP